jgi:GNAT superfamily N-acetyltransferase
MSFEIIPAHDVPFAQQADLFTQAFAGYVGGSFDLNAEALARFVFHQGIDICHSRFLRTAQGLVGFAYINRTGNISRLAGMGVVPAARREGSARQLLLHLLEESRTRGDQAMVLEVIEQNPAAHQLYRREGFREIARLLSWRRKPAAIPDSADEPEEISLTIASQMPSANEFPELPWQISRHAIAKVAGGRAFRTGNAIAVIGDPKGNPVRVHALSSCSSETPNWMAMRAALGAIVNRYPDREFFAPPVFPGLFGEKIFQPLGFAGEKLTQALMRYDLEKP